jgi:hypothetical protein
MLMFSQTFHADADTASTRSPVAAAFPLIRVASIKNSFVTLAWRTGRQREE